MREKTLSKPLLSKNLFETNRKKLSSTYCQSFSNRISKLNERYEPNARVPYSLAAIRSLVPGNLRNYQQFFVLPIIPSMHFCCQVLLFMIYDFHQHF